MCLYNENGYKTERMVHMKKIIAVLLSVLCVFSCLAAPVSAISIEDLDLLDILGDADDPLLYCITYQNQTLSGVKMMYKPNPTVSFSGPGFVTVTKDTPLAIDHDFVCWRDKDGKLYYAGDTFYVDGECTLYAVWEEKKGDEVHAIRVFRCAMLTFVRMISKALGVFKDLQDFKADRTEAMEKAVAAFNEAINAAKAQQNVTIKKDTIRKLALRTYNCPTTASSETLEKMVREFFKNYDSQGSESFSVSAGATADGKLTTDLIRPYGSECAVVNDKKLKDATVQELDEGGTKITLSLFHENVSLTKSGLTVPEIHAQYIEPLDFTGEDILSATLHYSDAKVVATLDENGKLVSLVTSVPLAGESQIAVQSLLIDTKFEAVLKESYTFTY